MNKKDGSIGKVLVAGAMLAIAGCAGGEDTSGSTDQEVKGGGAQSRVFITYEPGFKDHAKNAVAAAHGKLHYEFDDDGSVVASVPANALNGLSHNPHVLDIEEDVQRMPLAVAPPDETGQGSTYGTKMVQALDMQAAGYEGQGVKVCIIDSGLSEELLPTGPLPRSQVTYVPNATLPPNHDGFGHGTHVAGTIAGNNYGIGVAPSANLIIVRVFGDDGAWAYSSTLMYAAQQCQAYGAKVVSMSLGGGRANKREQKQFDKMAQAGILNIAAAGNDGTTGTSYPAGYGSVVSVAAIDVNKAHASFSQQNADVELSAPGVAVWSSLPYQDITTVKNGNATAQANIVENAARGTVTGTLVDGGLCDTANSAWSGKVVLCARGTVSFLVKVQNAQSSGALAAVISNNTDGALFATLGDGNSSTIPAVGITQADGSSLKAGATVTVTATHDTTKLGYDAWDGTSMATPHVSGVAAAVWSACPGKTASQVRAALDSTAQDLGTAGRDNTFGYGVVQACKAAKALCNPAGLTCSN
jgi:subtilisin family serine protease